MIIRCCTKHQYGWVNYYKSPLPLTDRTMHCLAPTMLYTDDDQCDKLVTDGGHQFTTLTIHLD